ncbi:MAG: hypothetical protein OEN23_10840 [Paracoccaceae bacterium]|nr:hypothetical protein [Paracoccaceae bacterium]
MPRSILIATMALVTALTACEEFQGVQRRQWITPEFLMQYQDAGGLLVERHGLPWPSATPEETVATLRMPEGAARDLRFREISPGQILIDRGERLVLHFNPVGPIDATANCQANEPLETGQGGDGFVVSVTFCKGDIWLVHATFDADDVAERDWLAYYLRMQELFGIMFPPDSS